MDLPAGKVDIDNLKKHLAAIARLRDPFENYEALMEVQDYIEKKLRSYGYQIGKPSFEIMDRRFENIIARKSFDATQPRFILGSHFDAVPGSPGADDNASGMAGFLEAARILANSPASQRIDFIAFNLEEYAMLGSTHYVRQLKKEKRKILGMFSLEMIGYTSQEKGSQRIPLPLRPLYPDTGNFLALVGNNKSASLLNRARDSFKTVPCLRVETLTVPINGWLLPDVRLSDHSPFWDAGYPALLVTDTSFYRNPNYHSPADLLETLDLEFLRQVTEGIILFTQQLR